VCEVVFFENDSDEEVEEEEKEETPAEEAEEAPVIKESRKRKVLSPKHAKRMK